MSSDYATAGQHASGHFTVPAASKEPYPEDVLARLRDRMPAASFLLPGVGAQGGRVEDLAPAFAPGPAGGLVTVSRALVHAGERDGLTSGAGSACSRYGK